MTPETDPLRALNIVMNDLRWLLDTFQGRESYRGYYVALESAVDKKRILELRDRLDTISAAFKPEAV